MPSTIQRSFAGGEIAPSLYGRSDQAKYQTGLRTCKNFIIMRHGGVTNRPGTKMIAQVADSSRSVRLMKFVFNAEQTYVLEFGHLYIRFIKNGVQLFSGDDPYQITTPYQEQHLRDIQYVQSGDVITLVHPNYAPRTLSRTGDTSWALATITYAPSVAAPTKITIDGTAGTASQYMATAVKELTYEESLPSAIVGNTNATASTSNKNTVTVGAVTGIYEFNVYKRINGVFGYIGTARPPFDPQVRTWTRTAQHVTITLPTGHLYNAGEPIFLSNAAESTLNGVFTIVNNPAVTATTVSIANPSGIVATSGSVTVSYNATFVDDGIAPDTTDTPPQERNPFPSAGNYPGAVSYYQQRSVFAATTNEPEKVWFSRTGNFKNFTIRSPLQDDDAVTFTIAGRQVNEVRHLIEVGNLLVLTSGGEWRVMGDGDGVIKPSAINLKQEGYSGAANIQPIVIGNNALYIQARGNIARDLRYDLQSDGYNGKDLTVFAAHLFDGYKLVTWDYAQIPHSIVWTIRDDGTLLGLTYLREHDVWGWHQHTTDGQFEDVVCVPEGTEDAIYVVVKRLDYTTGTYRRFIERFAPRYTSQVIDIKRDAFFVDCGATYDGKNTDTNHALRVTQGTGVSVRDTMILESVGYDQFTPFDVGNAFEVTMQDAQVIRFKVIEFVDERKVNVLPSQDVTTNLPESNVQWTKMVKVLRGIDHLIGRTVTILADGDVHPSLTVDPEGTITLNRPCGVVHVGIGYTSTLKTLALDNPGGETLFDKNKMVTKVAMLVESSRGIFAGPDESHLREYKQRRYEDYDEPTRPVTGLVEVQTVAQWDKQGVVAVVQQDPLPVSVLSIVPTVTVSPR
jgi:hypothetical protein